MAGQARDIGAVQAVAGPRPGRQACERDIARGHRQKSSSARCASLSSPHFNEPAMPNTVKRELIDSPEQPEQR